MQEHLRRIDSKGAPRTDARDAQEDRLCDSWAALLGRRGPSHWQFVRLPPDSYPNPTWPYSASEMAVYFGAVDARGDRHGTGAMLTRDPASAGKWLLFDCTWEHDVPTGRGRLVEYPCGVCKYAEGDMYVGELDECGDRHGSGKYTDASGAVVWDGQWAGQWPVADEACLELLLPRIVDNAVVDGTDRYSSAV